MLFKNIRHISQNLAAGLVTSETGRRKFRRFVTSIPTGDPV